MPTRFESEETIVRPAAFCSARLARQPLAAIPCRMHRTSSVPKCTRRAAARATGRVAQPLRDQTQSLLVPWPRVPQRLCNQLPAGKGRRGALHVLKPRCAGNVIATLLVLSIRLPTGSQDKTQRARTASGAQRAPVTSKRRGGLARKAPLANTRLCEFTKPRLRSNVQRCLPTPAGARHDDRASQQRPHNATAHPAHATPRRARGGAPSCRTPNTEGNAQTKLCLEYTMPERYERE